MAGAASPIARGIMTPTLKAELMMHVFRLMRSGGCRTAKEVMQAAQEDFPEVPKAQIAEVMAELANRLLHNLD